jgi:methionyl-tRNA synthetase
MSEVNFGNDGDYSDKSFVLKVNTNLANELGNLCQRTMSMVYKNCDKKVPVPGEFTDADNQLLGSADALRERAAEAMSKQAIHKYSEVMVRMIVEANKYIDDQAPWVLRKTDIDRMGTVLYVIMEVLRYSAILYQPLIPSSANKILDAITVSADERTFAHLNDRFRITPGSAVTQPQGIFPRIELPTEQLVDA